MYDFQTSCEGGNSRLSIDRARASPTYHIAFGVVELHDKVGVEVVHVVRERVASHRQSFDGEDSCGIAGLANRGGQAVHGAVERIVALAASDRLATRPCYPLPLEESREDDGEAEEQWNLHTSFLVCFIRGQV